MVVKIDLHISFRWWPIHEKYENLFLQPCKSKTILLYLPTFGKSPFGRKIIVQPTSAFQALFLPILNNCHSYHGFSKIIWRCICGVVPILSFIYRKHGGFNWSAAFECRLVATSWHSKRQVFGLWILHLREWALAKFHSTMVLCWPLRRFSGVLVVPILSSIYRNQGGSAAFECRLGL